MEEWKEYKATDFCKNVTDGTHDSPKQKSKGYYLITSKHIKGNTIDFDSAYKISEEDYNKIIQRSKVDQWDVIISMIGAYCGFCYLEKSTKTDYAIKNVGLFKVGSEIKSKWLYYYLTSPAGQYKLHLLRTGSSQPYIALNSLRNITIPVPDEKTMRSIVSVLQSLDEKIEVNRRINNNLEQQAQALFKSWFVDFEPFKDKPFVESELGMIPQSWRVVAFKDFITPTTEKVPVGSLPEYSVTNNGIIPRDAKFNKKLSKETSKNKVLRKDNLVFGMSREILNWGIMEDEIGGVSSAYNVYKIDKGIIDPVYLKLYMTARISDFNSLIGTAAREGQSLDKGALMQKTVYVPSTKIIGEFFRLYLSIVALKKEAEEESRRLADLRYMLLPRLMSGKLKVSDVDA